MEPNNVAFSALRF